MAELRLLLSGIEFKVRGLMQERQERLQELAELKAENEELKQQIDILNQQLRQYEENTRADALAAALLETEEHSAVKDRIDGLLEEIDQCIKLLNQ